MSKLFEYFGIAINDGDYIFKEGDKADALYMIYKGRVQINKRIGNIQKEIKILEESEFVGEMALINGLPRSADAVALGNCKLIRMNKESFEKTILENNQFASNFIKFLSTRLRDTNEMVARLSILERSQSILSELIHEVLQNGTKNQSKSWHLIRLGTTVEKLMGKLNFSREEIVTSLEYLSNENKITIKKDQNNTSWIAFPVK